MKTITISELDHSISAFFDEAREENLILQLPDGSEFILAEIDTFAREIALTHENKDLMVLLAQRKKETKRVSLKDAKALLDL